MTGLGVQRCEYVCVFACLAGAFPISPASPVHCTTLFFLRLRCSQVRVFSVQRVSKSWNARRECIRRSYSYFVPASVLGLALDGGKEDQRRLHLLQHAWESFQGTTRPFHNYTKRRLYREHAGDSRSAGRRSRGQDGPAPLSSSASSSGSGNRAGERAGNVQAEGIGVGDCSSSKKGQVQVAWKFERDDADPIVRRHFRYV